MLEAPAFKKAIAGQGAILGVIVSPFVYETHIKPMAASSIRPTSPRSRCG